MRTPPKLSRALFALIVSLASPSFAQRDPGAVARAQALFDQAIQAMKDGKYDVACPKLVESQRLDPGLGTELHLADCYEKSGKLASAWATFSDAAEAASRANDKRAQVAKEHVASLAPKVPYLVLKVTSPAPGQVVTVDGASFGAASWGSPAPFDPGSHAVEVTAPGKKRATKTVTLSAGKTETLVLDALADDDAGATPSTTQATASATQAQPPSNSPPSGGAWERPVGYVLGGVGLVGLGLSAYFRAHAGSQHDDAANLCQPLCGDDAKSAQNSAESSVTVSRVFLGVGAAALLGGVALVVLAPSSDSASTASIAPSAGKNGGGLTLGGTF